MGKLGTGTELENKFSRDLQVRASFAYKVKDMV